MIETGNLEKAKILIKTEKKPVMIKAQSDEFNRKILEYGKFDILVFPDAENSKRKISLKNIDSGFNIFLAKVAKKNNITIGLNLKDILDGNKREKAETLSKIIEIIRYCKKEDTKINLLNYKDKRTALSFLISLGAGSSLAAKALDF